MGTAKDSAAAAEKYGFAAEQFVEDPQARLYRAFELGQAGLRQFLSPTTWARGARAVLVKGHGFGLPQADPRQMPGVFLVREGKIVNGFRHELVSDRPDYLALARIPAGVS